MIVAIPAIENIKKAYPGFKVGAIKKESDMNKEFHKTAAFDALHLIVPENTGDTTEAFAALPASELNLRRANVVSALSKDLKVGDTTADESDQQAYSSKASSIKKISGDTSAQLKIAKSLADNLAYLDDTIQSSPLKKEYIALLADYQAAIKDKSPWDADKAEAMGAATRDIYLKRLNDKMFKL